jgi:hypothetical protein
MGPNISFVTIFFIKKTQFSVILQRAVVWVSKAPKGGCLKNGKILHSKTVI